MKKLDGKVALITGSDSGIGRAIAIQYAREGARVVITYHSDQEGAEQAEETVEDVGRDALVVNLDVSSEESIDNVFTAILEKYGQLDILVNNAAVNGQGIPLAEMSTEIFDKTIRTNLYGTFFCCRKFVQYLLQNKRKGKIINVTSVHEEICSPGNADYNASKAAVRNLTRTLALELAAEGINVNNIAPGMILTPMNQEAMDDADVRREKEQHIPMQRAGQPEEIAKLALFLASADSDYVTGSTYVMDGGLMQAMGQGA